MGQGDNYNLETSHVLPALIRKFHLGKCLEGNDWDSIRLDLNKRPIEGIDGKARDEEISQILSKYGVTIKGDDVSISLWGSGKPKREFLHSDELADACIFLMNETDFNDLLQINKVEGEIRNTHINIGTGIDQTIRELAEIVRVCAGFKGQIQWDSSKPDGTMRKLMNVSKLNSLGWKAGIMLKEGIDRVYKGYVDTL